MQTKDGSDFTLRTNCHKLSQRESIRCEAPIDPINYLMIKLIC